MTAQLALGTYRCQAVPEAAARAAASGAQWIDTTPNYATGRAQILLAPALALALAAHPWLNVSTKTGYFTAATGTDAVNDGVLNQDHSAAGHSLAPDYVRWQTSRKRAQLGRRPPGPGPAAQPRARPPRRPPRPAPGDPGRLRCPGGRGRGWACGGVRRRHVDGPGGGAFTMGELLALAAEAAGGQQHHLVAIQLPVSLVMMTPIVQALHGQGPLPAAVDAGLGGRRRRR